MKKPKKQENCYLCKKKLSFWITSGKKHEGHKICTSCGTSIANKDLKKWSKEFSEELKDIKHNFKEEIKKEQQLANKKTSKAEGLADKLDRWGKKLFVGLTIPIILFLLGLFTMPIGIIFWIIAVVMFMTLFTKGKVN